VRGASTAAARTRIGVAGIVGAGCGLAAATSTAWPVAVLAGWDGAAVVFAIWVWVGVRGLSAEDARRVATREDPSRAAADLILLSASVASLLGSGVTLAEASNSAGGEKAILVALATSSVALSWLVVHAVFMLRYARLYYGDVEGGIDFPGGEKPVYRDFAYLAFTIGMTFQVSDTDLSASEIRATALRQALLSYLFSVCIVGLTINVVAGLFK
jgi:uncharacterized membrane protein